MGRKSDMQGRIYDVIVHFRAEMDMPPLSVRLGKQWALSHRPLSIST